ncbi:MAG: hypothetical protein HOO91_10735 [Bacteroidales bacterium]|nr:hypothetical protein [Bacteroidales bacterium]
MEAIAVLQMPNSNQTRKELELKEYEDYESDAFHFLQDYYTDRIDAEPDERFNIDSSRELAQVQREDLNNKITEKDKWSVDDTDGDIGGDISNKQTFFYEDELAVEEFEVQRESIAVEFFL